MNTKKLTTSAAFLVNALVLGVLLNGERATSTPPMERLDVLLGDIDKLDRKGRYERWLEIDRLVQGDPAAMERCRRIAAGKVALGRYQKFVAAAQVAGFGVPTTCGAYPAPGLTLDEYLGWFRGYRHDRNYLIDCEPGIKKLKLDPPPPPNEKRTTQDALWDLLEKEGLIFRIRYDSTFSIAHPMI